MRKPRTLRQAVLTSVCIIVLGAAGLRYMYSDRVFPGTYIGAFPIGGTEISQLQNVLAAYDQQLQSTPIHIRFRGRETIRTLGVLGVHVDPQKTSEEILKQMKSATIISRTRITPVLTFDATSERRILIGDFAQVLSLPKDAGIQIGKDYQITVVQSQPGEDIDVVALNRDITSALAQSVTPAVIVSTTKADPVVQASQLQDAEHTAQDLIQNGFHLTYNDTTYTIGKADVARLMKFEPIPIPHIAFDQDGITQYLDDNIEPSIHVEPVNARFHMEGSSVEQFALPKNGVDVDTDATIRAISNALMQNSSSAAIITKDIEPTFSDTHISDSMGIQKLLTTGMTDFRGSPKNRMHNVAVGAEKFNGILVAPGEEFSFDKLLGPVDASTGYLPELVIKDNATLPEYGGGLCQVSTTVFRAAMQAGLKITERHNHSYAVRYYGTPGFDATIYPPYTDFRFLNDTPGYLLIQTHIDGTKLYFEFWGSDDGRHTEIDGPHPYDRMPDGAVKSVLKRTVTDSSGQVIQNDTFYSNYKSPNLFPHEPAKQAANTSTSASDPSAANSNA